MYRYAIAALALLATATVATAGGAPGRGSHSSVEAFPGIDNIPSEGAMSTLLRRRRFVWFELETDGLDPLSPYTIWAVIFNRPRHCMSSPCGEVDLPVSPGHDARVEASVAFAGGGISDEGGGGHFVGHVHTVGGRVMAPLLFGTGALDTRRAEIHLIVRGHGYPPAEELFDAISSFGGGCTEANLCEDQQFAVHLPYHGMMR